MGKDDIDQKTARSDEYGKHNIRGFGGQCKEKYDGRSVARKSSLLKIAPTQVSKPKTKSGLQAKLSCIAARIRNNSILKDPSLDVPLKATLSMYLVGLFYCSSRTLIIVLDIIQLRSMPQSAYETVEWSSFIPHI